MDFTIKNRVERLAFTTKITPENLETLQTKLDSIGPIGEEALKIARGLAEVLENIRGATGDLKLIALEAENGDLSFSITFEASSFRAPSEIPTSVPSKRGAETSIYDLGLSARARTVIERIGDGTIETAGDLAEHSIHTLQEQRSCGAKTIAEIQEKLRAIGLRMKGS